ncbi:MULTISPECIES: sigma-70 domain-containing protein [unclassified Ruegeria]|uniref:sigma-70 domain-containing protein n=1 Tax=unclassified Ruegeria TaxID=2625375 RepID=UPI00147D1C7B|nr:MULTISPECIES: sigma-70 domain-containing protein [unclassified Ruegeria]
MNAKKNSQTETKAEARKAVDRAIPPFHNLIGQVQLLKENPELARNLPPEKLLKHLVELSDAAQTLAGNQSRLITLLEAPRKTVGLVYSDVAKLSEWIKEQTGKQPTQRELAEHLDVSPARINQILNKERPT